MWSVMRLVHPGVWCLVRRKGSHRIRIRRKPFAPTGYGYMSTQALATVYTSRSSRRLGAMMGSRLACVGGVWR